MDHASVYKACESVSNQMIFNRQFRDNVNDLVQQLAGIFDLLPDENNPINDMFMANDMFTNEEIETGKVLIM